MVRDRGPILGGSGLWRRLLPVVAVAVIVAGSACGNDAARRAGAVAGVGGSAPSHAQRAPDGGSVTGATTPATARFAAQVPPRRQASRRDDPSPTRRRVGVIGDSLTVSATEEITASLTARGAEVVGIDAVAGRRMATDLDGRPSGVSALAHLPWVGSVDVWVVALGTNDVGAQATPADLGSDMASVLDKLGPTTPVVWVDVYIASRVDASAAFDEQVRRRAIERGSMVVADWYNPARRRGNLVADGVHLSSSGRVAFAEVMSAAVDRLLPRAATGN